MIPVEWRDPRDLEVDAEKLLQQYSKEVRPVAGPPVPVEHILEGFLGLELELDDLNVGDLNRDKLGCLYVRDRKVVVDSKLENQEGRYTFTLGHEIGHWVLHREHCLREEDQLQLWGQEKKPSIICRKSERKTPPEWQADKFSSALLMPKWMVMDVLRKEERPETAWLFDHNTKEFLEMEKEEYFRAVASLYNKQFGVSVQAMQIRLEQLNLLREEVNVRLI